MGVTGQEGGLLGSDGLRQLGMVSLAVALQRPTCNGCKCCNGWGSYLFQLCLFMLVIHVHLSFYNTTLHLQRHSTNFNYSLGLTVTVLVNTVGHKVRFRHGV